MKRTIRRKIEKSKRQILRRLEKAVKKNRCQAPMITATNIQYEIAERNRAIINGGIGIMHQIARKTGLIDRIDERVELLKIHKPYHESDHVLNIAYNALCRGMVLEDIELRRKKVPLPSEARARLDRYIDEVRKRGEGPLLLSRYGRRLAPKEIGRICSRISKQASAHLGAEERIHLTPHTLRHTFLKHVADKHGVHYAQRLSGNVSIREVFRYTKPSDEEVEEDVERLFE